ncbi:hypothetical protein ABZ816_30000 [Actinosynnema sp. NPDC047251]|uniref:hypothetical protein n=1 Tax=Saccharothrix espanaensis TaxID=103731 RepID=UPI0011DDD10B|nr:hypothetical protein [Saccharothrix espanaensis]
MGGGGVVGVAVLVEAVAVAVEDGGVDDGGVEAGPWSMTGDAQPATSKHSRPSTGRFIRTPPEVF